MRKTTILLIEEDDDARPALRLNLRRAGYALLVAVDEESALAWVGGGDTRADIILVNLVGESPEDALAAGRRVRDGAGLRGSTPLVVMAEQYSRELEGTDVNVEGNDWITYLSDSAQLHSLLARVSPRSSTPR